jgi:Ca2+-binding RTX toxin-like protein
MRRTLLLMATTALALLVTSGVALAASINCPTAPGGYCYGTGSGDALYGTSNVDRIYGYGGTDLIYAYASGDFMYGGAQGDRMLGGSGADQMFGQGGADAIYGGAGERDFITCEGTDDLVYYDAGLDVLRGCAESGRIELAPPDGFFEVSGKVLVAHGEGKEELCVAEEALEGHLAHGDEIIGARGC